MARAFLRFVAGHNLGREKPVNADLLPAFLAGYPVYDMRCWWLNVRRLAVSCAADAIVVQVGAKNQMRRSLVRPVC